MGEEGIHASDNPKPQINTDTLCAWMDMYDEARYVAAMNSDEEVWTELVKIWTQKD